MGIIFSENWDIVTAPAIPTGWNCPSAIITKSTGATPLSSPNMIDVWSGGTSGTPNYGTIAATVPFSSGINNSFQATLTGLSDGVQYAIGVRASKGVAEESNTTFVLATADATGPSAFVGLTAMATA
jgi:hypothetical protein